MTTYYFIVYPADYPINAQFDRALVRVHELSPKAAEKRREEIENEINDGSLWKIEDAINKTGRRKVVLMPYSHAKEYTDFSKWLCNKEWRGKKRLERRE